MKKKQKSSKKIEGIREEKYTRADRPGEEEEGRGNDCICIIFASAGPGINPCAHIAPPGV